MADEQSKAPEGGAAPAKSAKVQPKKETVRINLPPKPTAAPTVKIPAPSAVAAAKPAAPAAAPPSAATQKLPAAAAPAPAKPAAAPSAAPRPAPSMAPRAVPAAATVSGMDKLLAIFAMVVCALLVVRLFLLGQG